MQLGELVGLVPGNYSATLSPIGAIKRRVGACCCYRLQSSRFSDQLYASFVAVKILVLVLTLFSRSFKCSLLAHVGHVVPG